ncbi:hypothetical protein KRMM14A1259_45820 [Krasilnikovia sp. MM14-A1259]
MLLSGAVIASASAGLVATSEAPALAYTRIGCKFQGTNPALHYKKNAATASHWTATVEGAKRWNAVNAPGSFASTTGSTYNIFVTEQSFLDHSIFAQTTGTCTSGGTWQNNSTRFTWNTEGTVGLNATQQRMIATHELGHSLGLNHMNTSSCSGTKSVMAQGSIKWSCGWGTEPWPDDINGVNAIY